MDRLVNFVLVGSAVAALVVGAVWIGSRGERRLGEQAHGVDPGCCGGGDCGLAAPRRGLRRERIFRAALDLRRHDG